MFRFTPQVQVCCWVTEIVRGEISGLCIRRLVNPVTAGRSVVVPLPPPLPSPQWPPLPPPSTPHRLLGSRQCAATIYVGVERLQRGNLCPLRTSCVTPTERLFRPPVKSRRETSSPRKLPQSRTLAVVDQEPLTRKAAAQIWSVISAAPRRRLRTNARCCSLKCKQRFNGIHAD